MIEIFVSRREVMNYIRDNLETYSSMIKSEVGYASTNDYFSRKLRTDHQVSRYNGLVNKIAEKGHAPTTMKTLIRHYLYALII